MSENLISLNPVLRFKLGILKFLNGGLPKEESITQNGVIAYRRIRLPFSGKYLWQQYDSSTRGYKPIKEEVLVNGYYLKPDGTKVHRSVRLLNQTKPIILNKPVDGDFGPKSEAALTAAELTGYTVNRKKNRTISIKANSNKKNNGLANMYEMTHAAQTGSMNQIPVINPSINLDNGHAIYLHYPNFIGRSKNALKIAGTDLGEMIGDPSLPVGHSAVVLVDNLGNSNYYEYGRYVPSNGNVIGDEQRPTVKGGNWRNIPLPKLKEGENDSTYIARIQNMLPDTKTGAYQAMSIPSVDVEKATKWVYDLANNHNRKEYNIFNTCATGACNSILPFRASKINNNENKNNREGYSEEALAWAKLPFTTDSYALKARKASSNIYIMNNK